MKFRRAFTLCLAQIMLVGLVSLSGCVAQEAVNTPEQSVLTKEQAEAVNTAENLLKHYKTVTYAQLDYIGGNTVHMTFFRNAAGEQCIIEDDNGYEAYRTDALHLARENGETAYHIYGEQECVVGKYLFMTPGGSFVSQTEDGSGNIHCEMRADIDEDYAKALESWSVTTADKMLTTAVFAAGDYRVLSLDFAILHPDGTELKIASSVVLYDETVPYSELVSAYDRAEKARVTIALEDGGTRTALLPKGACFTWSCDEGCSLYEDANGESILSATSKPLDDDTTLYVFKGQGS